MSRKHPLNETQIEPESEEQMEADIGKIYCETKKRYEKQIGMPIPEVLWSAMFEDAFRSLHSKTLHELVEDCTDDILGKQEEEESEEAEEKPEEEEPEAKEPVVKQRRIA